MIALLLPLAAAAEEPEAVYARFHRAAVSGDLDEMLKYAPEAQKAELQALSPAQRSAQVKMLAAAMPRAYVMRNKNVNPDGQGARLWLSGQGPQLVDEKPEMLYGTVRMVQQRGEWKVAGSDWTNYEPGPIAAPKAAGAPEKPKAATTKAAPGRSTAVGAMGSAPERKLGVQKPPCEFKPVMTAEDLANCK